MNPTSCTCYQNNGTHAPSCATLQATGTGSRCWRCATTYGWPTTRCPSCGAG